MSDAQATQYPSYSSAVSPPTISTAAFLPFLNITPGSLVNINEAECIVWSRGQAGTVFGYAREELVDQPLDLLLLLPQRYCAAHAAHRQHYFSAPRMRPMGMGLDLVGRRKDGTEFPVEISLSLERDGHWEGELAYTGRDGHLVTVESRQVLIHYDEG